MAEDDNSPSIIPGAVVGAGVGAGVVAGGSYYMGTKAFSADNLKHLESLATKKVGEKIAVGAGAAAVEKEVTKGMLDQGAKVQGLATEYGKAGHLGKVKVGFKGMSTGSKVGLGALAAVAVIGTAVAVNHFRQKSFAEREMDRRAAMGQLQR